MIRRGGITETAWQSCSVQYQLFWRMALLVGALGAATLFSATGKTMLSTLLGFTAVVFAQLTVESQRCLSNLDGWVRKKLTRFIVMTSLVAVLVLGAATFLGIGALLAASMMTPQLLGDFEASPALQTSLAIIVMSAVIGFALFKVFRDLNLEHAFWRAPASGLRAILIERRYVARSALELVAFELMAHILIFAYCFTMRITLDLVVGSQIHGS